MAPPQSGPMVEAKVEPTPHRIDDERGAVKAIKGRRKAKKGVKGRHLSEATRKNIIAKIGTSNQATCQNQKPTEVTNRPREGGKTTGNFSHHIHCS